MPDEEPQGLTQIGLSAVRSLGAQPMLLGFLLVNIILIVVAFMALREQRVQTHDIVRYLLERCVSKT
jgi:hypothetical protein